MAQQDQTDNDLEQLANQVDNTYSSYSQAKQQYHNHRERASQNAGIKPVSTERGGNAGITSTKEATKEVTKEAAKESAKTLVKEGAKHGATTAGATAGATAGSAAGPVGTVAGAVIGDVIERCISFLIKNLKTILCCIAIFSVGTIAFTQLMPNLIMKSVEEATTYLLHKVEDTPIGTFFSLVYEHVPRISFFDDEDEITEEMTEEDAAKLIKGWIDEALQTCRKDAREEIKKICEEQGYNYDETITMFDNKGDPFRSVDYAMLIACYSSKVDYKDVSKKEFKKKLKELGSDFYTLDIKPCDKEVITETPIYKYKPMCLRVKLDDNTYGYKTYYQKTDQVERYVTQTSGEYEPEYKKVKGNVKEVPLEGEPRKHKNLYIKTGNKHLVTPTIETIHYANVTMVPFKAENVYDIFDIDKDAPFYEEGGMTNEQMILARIETLEGIVGPLLRSTPQTPTGPTGNGDVWADYDMAELVDLSALYTQEELDFIFSNITRHTVGANVVILGLSKKGIPYSQDGNKRMSGNYYDCSSFAYCMYRDAAPAYALGATTAASEAQYLSNLGYTVYDRDAGDTLNLDALCEGDLIFYTPYERGSMIGNGRYKNICHVAIYIGGGATVETGDSRGVRFGRNGNLKTDVTGASYEQIVSYVGRPTGCFSSSGIAPSILFLQDKPLCLPLDYTTTRVTVTTEALAERWGTIHKGMDLAAPKGTPIYATADGTVTKVIRGQPDGSLSVAGYGNCVYITHDYDGLSTIYGHMVDDETYDVLVNEGEHVQCGQLIGYVGTSGNSTGNHLHYELRQQGEPINPRTYFIGNVYD